MCVFVFKVHQDLIALQKNVVLHQPMIDQLVEDKHSTRRLTEKSRHHLPRTAHHDLDRLDSDVNRITNRWNNVCSQLVDRYNNHFVLIGFFASINHLFSH